MSQPEARSYATIISSSALVGGAQFLNILISLVRVKFAAVLLGSEGIGLIGLLFSSTNILRIVSGLGIRWSGTREVSQANASQNSIRLGSTARVMGRICWITGLVGWMLAILLSKPLSFWTFGNTDHSTAIAILGATVFWGQLSTANEALLQGTRRIKDWAIQSILATLIGAIASIALFLVFGPAGIVPALLAMSLSGLVFSMWFARRVPLERTAMRPKYSIGIARRLIRLGSTFMYVAFLTAFVQWATQAYLANQVGVSENGIYRCAWSLSGQFAAFILAAMGADYFPRLSAAVSDYRTMQQLVNEQTEIGILLALPGLIATLVFAPWIVSLFYSREFLMAAELLPWFVTGIFVRVVHWPMDYVQAAVGASRAFAITQSIGHFAHLGLIIILTSRFGVIGCAFAFLLMNLLMIVVIKLTVQQLIQFRWSPGVRMLLGISTVTIGLTFAIVELLPAQWVISVGVLFNVSCAFLCLRGLLTRVGPEHWLSRMFRRVPFLVGRS